MNCFFALMFLLFIPTSCFVLLKIFVVTSFLMYLFFPFILMAAIIAVCFNFCSTRK